MMLTKEADNEIIKISFEKSSESKDALIIKLFCL